MNASNEVEQPLERPSGRRGVPVPVIVIGAAFALLLLFCAIGWFGGGGVKQREPVGYTYASASSAGGVKLHWLTTTPDNIALKLIGRNVAQSEYDGINGGFFFGGLMVSLAAEDDVPLNGERGVFGSGWYNEKYARGALVYDKAAGRLHVQVVSSADELTVSDRSRYWAQGGISMSLHNDQGWKTQALRENMPFPDDNRLRSGIVYDTGGQIYLVVASTLCTAGQFRSAIKELIGGGRLEEGIFLDGDGSSQLRSAAESLVGDGREVLQMIAVAPHTAIPRD